MEYDAKEAKRRIGVLYSQCERLLVKLELATDPEDKDMLCRRLEKLNCELELQTRILELMTAPTDESRSARN